MVKLYLLALAAAVLVFAPSDVSAVGNFHYTCQPWGVSVNFTPSPGRSGKVAVKGASNSACSKSYEGDHPFSYDFKFSQCTNGNRYMQLTITEVETVVNGGSSSSSSSSSSQTIRC